MSTALEISKPDQDAAMSFSRQLLSDWMRQNTIDNINLYQSLWVFHRFENFTITQAWGTGHVDIFKMFQSGAVPTLYYTLLRIQPDDMTQTYHWLTQARIDWVKQRLVDFMGAGMAGYIATLP